MTVEVEEHADGGVTLEIDPSNTDTPEAHATLAGQAIHDAARAEVIAERAEETAIEAREQSERTEEQWQQMSSTMEAMRLQMTEMQTSLEQSQAQNLDLLQQMQSPTGESTLLTDPEEPTAETLEAIAETISSGETTEPSSETRMEAPGESVEENGAVSEEVAHPVNRRVLMY